MDLILLASDMPDSSGADTVNVTFTALPPPLLLPLPLMLLPLMLPLVTTSCRSLTKTFVGKRDKARATAVMKVPL